MKLLAQARWQALSTRERRSVSVLLALIGMWLFWSLAVAPALNTLQQSDQRRTQLSQQASQMLALQGQAEKLKSRLPVTREVAWRRLQGLTAAPQFQLTLQGDRILVQVKEVPAAHLAQWLAQANTQAQLLPIEAHLTRGAATETVMWNGTLVLGLPSP